MRIGTGGIALWALGLLASVAPAEERYYVTLFASQAEPNLPRLAHTFAVFSKATGGAGFPKNAKVENQTISWLPATLEIRPLRLAPEKGKNVDLAATVQVAKAHNASIFAWGPFETRKELFDLAGKRPAELNEGQLSYIAIDGRFRGQGAVNCIHAVSDVAPNAGSLNTGTAHGAAATHLVVQHFQKWLVQPQTTHAWLAQHLGVPREDFRWENAEAPKIKEASRE